MRMPFNLKYIDMDYHDKTKPLLYIYLYCIIRIKFIFVTIFTHLHTSGFYPDFALISQN